MVTIFPNNSAKAQNGKIGVEKNLSPLLEPLLKSKIAFKISAVQTCGNSLSNHPVTVLPHTLFLSCGKAKNTTSKLVKILNYSEFLIPLTGIIKKSTFCYIFIPGHIGLLAILLCWYFNKPYALYYRGDFDSLTPKILLDLQDKIVSKANFIICTGESLRLRLSKIQNNVESVVPMSPILVKDVKSYSPRESSTNKITVLFVGQLVREKGIFELVRAARKIMQRTLVDFEIDIVGEGSDRVSLEKVIVENNLTTAVRISGFINDRQKLESTYRRSDIFCLPSYSEGFPRVLYEAMYFALPIVTTPVGQIESLIKDGENGLFCQPCSAESLAEKLTLLVSDVALCKKLGQAARLTLNPWLKEWEGNSHGQQVLKWLEETHCANACPSY